MHLTPLNFFLVAVGLFLHIGMKLMKIQRKKPDTFDVRIYIKHNYMQIIVSTIAAYVVLLFADNISEGILDLHVHNDSNYYRVYAVIAGYNNQMLFDQYMKKNKP